MLSLIDKLTLNDLDGEQLYLAECIGIEPYKRLLKAYSGGAIYVPKISTVTAQIRNKVIYSEFDGHNYLSLGKKYNLSESSIRRILSDKSLCHQQ